MTTKLMRLFGWGFGGERVVDAAPQNHWQSRTLISAISADGVLAAMLLDGPLNGEAFAGFCRETLAPVLEPGRIVALDNLSSHKSSAAEDAIRRAGASLAFLPPYSPDLNPIEQIFSKIKRVLRRLRPRSWEAVLRAAREALLSITANDCAACMEHCGYELF